MVFVFFSSYSPRYQNPSSSFLIFTVDFTFISGDPGPNALGANLVSHFQLPSNGFMYASSSADGLGIGGAAGAAAGAAGAAAGAAAAGLAAGALSSARPTTGRSNINAQVPQIRISRSVLMGPPLVGPHLSPSPR